MKRPPTVLVSLVTFNSARWLERCLESVRSQTYSGITVCAWDNASDDGSVDILARYAGFLSALHFSNRNIGFCGAQNRLITADSSDYVLVLNPDVVIEPEFVGTLVAALEEAPGAGAASGKLWRWEENGDLAGAPGTRILDTTGMYMTPTLRHFDRGSGEPDRGQYDRREYVFGASGCAAFYRRRMLNDVRAGDEYFDEDFFAYREDADLAWRAQWLGYPCLYVPEARGWHVRRVLPERRSSLPAAINMHSVKNRFLMRVKNLDAGTYARHFLGITARDVAIFGYVLIRERSSLHALPLFFKALPRALAVRRALGRHRRVAPCEIRSWFASKPVTRAWPGNPAAEV